MLSRVTAKMLEMVYVQVGTEKSGT